MLQGYRGLAVIPAGAYPAHYTSRQLGTDASLLSAFISSALPTQQVAGAFDQLHFGGDPQQMLPPEFPHLPCPSPRNRLLEPSIRCNLLSGPATDASF